MTGDLDQRINERAYEIWESEGRPEGRSRQHWEQARAEFADARSEAGEPGRDARGGGAGKSGGSKPAKSPAARSKSAKSATALGGDTGETSSGKGMEARAPGAKPGAKRSSRTKN